MSAEVVTGGPPATVSTELEKLAGYIVTYLKRYARGFDHRCPKPTILAELRMVWGPELNERTVRQAVELARRTSDDGARICTTTSGTGGYWFAETMDELLVSYRQDRRRAISLMVTLRERLRRGKRSLDHQQMRLFQ